jgi:hypothetical protein
MVSIRNPAENLHQIDGNTHPILEELDFVVFAK